MAYPDPVPARAFDSCPECGAPLVLRMAESADGRRRRFWGCSTYPVTGCRGAVPFELATTPATYEPRPPRQHEDGNAERSMTTVALAAVVRHDDPATGQPSFEQPTHVNDAPSRRAARSRAAAEAVGREYHRRVDERMTRVGDRWPLMVMAYFGFAGGAVLATAWIHLAVAGVALMAITALFVEALLRPSAAPTPLPDATTTGTHVDHDPRLHRRP